MKWPECGEEMEVMWVENEESICIGDKEYSSATVVGHCWNCGYDGRWDRLERNHQRFFFG